MFTGEESWGKFFDLVLLHDEYVNLPGIKEKRRITYLQYLDQFDVFTPPQCPMKQSEKMKDAYFKYLGSLMNYLEDFMRRTRPLENLDKLFTEISKDFNAAWEKGEVPGWGKDDEKTSKGGAATAGAGIWCADCEKAFSNENVYKHHLTQKKHLKAAEAKKAAGDNTEGAPNDSETPKLNLNRLKQRAIGEREYRIHRLAQAMQTTRSDTRVNVERRAGMTDRERQQEIALLYADTAEPTGPVGNQDSDDEEEDRIHNPLKLPLAWDGKPIPYWLYKLHGLGVEFNCEICGNFVYMGRRAFDKHFNEYRHIHGLRCLGINNTTLFREITGIKEAQMLWEKMQKDKKDTKGKTENVVQMEDGDGNVMPEKVFYDLQKQGLL